MSIDYRILGKPFGDNALFVAVNSGNCVYRLLFDCGESCLANLDLSNIQNIDHIFFSHFHMDHISGFDSFFRVNYNRDNKTNNVWGPQDTIDIMHHRFRGYTWNLVIGQPGKWVINEMTDQWHDQAVFFAADAFAQANDRQRTPSSVTLVGNADFEIKALLLDHGIPTLGYLLQEKQRYNIDKATLTQLSLPPGPWINSLKDFALADEGLLTFEQQQFTLGELRKALLRPKPGQSLAYLTDFLLDSASQQRLCAFIPTGCTIICESHYCHADLAHAQRNYHVTATQAAELASQAGAEKLILFHISQRYRPTGMLPVLQEARAIFPETYLPEQWLRK